MMRAKWRGFTLIELLVVVAIIALLISILLPSLSRARELSKRVVCSSNARAIGNACKIYAAEPWHNDNWPTPTFDTKLIGEPLPVQYATPNSLNSYAEDKGGCGNGDGVNPERDFPTDKDSNSTQISTTRAFWMLIRSGDTVPKTYICPSSGDNVDDTEEIDRYYDFKCLERVSYGYQVPFGPFDTRPSEDTDTRMGLIADKGPYAANEQVGVPGSGSGDAETYSITGSPRDWMRYNSFNHGGRGAGEGQNVYFADGHVDFEQKPIVGVDHDNIYTLMIDFASTEGRIWGLTPQSNEVQSNPYPGQGVFGNANELNDRATTDSLIWP